MRVGGQSKATRLAEHNLRTISRTESKTKSEGYMAAMKYKALEQNAIEAKAALGDFRGLQKHANWNNLKFHIRDEHPTIHSQFSRVDNDGFQVAGPHPFDTWKSGKSLNKTQGAIERVGTLFNIVQKANNDVHSLSMQERRFD